jgi:hypothetical protein
LLATFTYWDELEISCKLFLDNLLFDGIVEQAIEYKLIGGRVLYTDSTHLKANANKRHFEVHQVEQTPAAYLAELDAAIEADRAAAGKKSLRRNDDDATPPMKEVKVSTVDPDAGFMARDNKPTGFFYLDPSSSASPRPSR